MGDVPTRPDLGRAGRACALDLYLPPDEVPAPGAPGARRPIVVMVHGGGWRAGDKALEAVVWPKATWFLQRGCAFASVDYRLAPAATPREQARDVGAAVALLVARGAELGLDPERVVLIGHSAGAHLAALAVTDPTAFGAPADGAPPARAPVSATICATICAVVCLDTAAYDVPRLLAEVPARRATLEPVFGRDPEAQRLASPRAHVTPDRPVPPALLVWTGQRADARAASEDFAAALVAAGHRAEVWNAAHTDHGGVNRGLGAPGDPTTRAVARFLAQHVPGLATDDAAGEAPPPAAPAPDGDR